MKPNKEEWVNYMNRPQFEKKELNGIVKDILKQVSANGDEALRSYTLAFDQVELDQIEVRMEEVKRAISNVSKELKDAINLAKENIEKFHYSQIEKEQMIETSEGVMCWRKSVAIEKVGLYIPGGSAPLFSTILMLGIPALIAGCKEIVLCTPPQKDGSIHPAILYTANLVGINKIYKVGGAQAIAAMAYGTNTIPEVYKIFGPGNQFVTKAKELILLDGKAIDMPAGPSELLIIADKTCNPSFVAADLLSQAEHGIDSQVIILSNSLKIIQAVLVELKTQMSLLPRYDIIEKALKNGRAILLDSIDECFEFSNLYAPEHLIIASNQASNLTNKIVNAGSVFLGNYSCESAGDYASGTNHTLPTNGFAKCYSGVSVDSFVKKITFQELTQKGLTNIGSAIEIMAEAESLFAHKNAVSLRLKTIKNV